MTLIEKLQETGIHRAGSPKTGFRWVGASPKEIPRLNSLRIPPAWTDVAVSRSPASKLQAIGKDNKGRWQYRYGDRAVREREQKKYEKLIAFGKALPKARKVIDAGFRLPGLHREKVMACILHVLSTCFMRPGSQVYAKENGSFGIATLKRRHASVHGDTVRFDYMGKSGKRQVRELRDRRVSRLVRELKKLHGRDLFVYVGEDGKLVDIRRRHINRYIKETMGENFSAKDFRTWAGTMICANVLARTYDEMVPGRTDPKKVIAAAVKETAAQLGNTPAVCKASYIWPSVFTSFESGKVLEPHFDTVEALITCVGRRRSACEKALLEMLKEGRGAEPIALLKKVKKPETKLSRRMRQGPMRDLARAFTLH